MPKYKFDVTFANTKAGSFANPAIAHAVRGAEADFNYFFRSHTVPYPKSLTAIIAGPCLQIELDTRLPLKLGREGNALRQFSRFLVVRGLGSCLTGGKHPKLLKRI